MPRSSISSSKTNANFMNTPVYANVRKLYAHLVDIFEEGKKTGEMNPTSIPMQPEISSSHHGPRGDPLAVERYVLFPFRKTLNRFLISW